MENYVGKRLDGRYEIMEIIGTGESSGEDEPCRVGEEGRIEEHIGINLNAMSSGYGETI